MLSRFSLIQGPTPKRDAKAAPTQDARRYSHAEEADTQSSKARFLWSLENTSLVRAGGDATARTKTSLLPLQPKLIIGAVDDPLEHEADRIADRVLHIPEAAPRRAGHLYQPDHRHVAVAILAVVCGFDLARGRRSLVRRQGVMVPAMDDLSRCANLSERRAARGSAAHWRSPARDPASSNTQSHREQ